MYADFKTVMDYQRSRPIDLQIDFMSTMKHRYEHIARTKSFVDWLVDNRHAIIALHTGRRITVADVTIHTDILRKDVYRYRYKIGSAWFRLVSYDSEPDRNGRRQLLFRECQPQSPMAVTHLNRTGERLLAFFNAEDQERLLAAFSSVLI